MNVDVCFRIIRMGRTYNFPYESSVTEYSIDGGETWYNVFSTPFKELVPRELVNRAFAPEIKLKKSQQLIFEEDGNND